MLLSFFSLEVSLYMVPIIPKGNDKPMISAEPRHPKSSQVTALPMPIANIPNEMTPKTSPLV